MLSPFLSPLLQLPAERRDAGAGECAAHEAEELALEEVLREGFTGKGTISIEASHADDMLPIRVRDTGAGMSAEQLERVFTPYAQASAGASAVYGGTGLGLVISRGYCELMRGSLRDAATSRGRRA